MRGSSMLAMPLIALGIAISPTGAPAANLIQNGGFEDPTVGTGTYQTIGVGSSALPYWTIVGNSGNNVDLVHGAYSESSSTGVNPFNAQQGVNSLDLTGNGNVGTAVGIAQSIATVAGRQYTLSFFVGRARPFTAFTGTDSYSGVATVDLSVNGGTRMSYTNSNVTPGQINWQEYSQTFTATGATTLITFYNGTPISPTTNFAGLDDVRLVEAVPEPASMAMVASCAFALALISFARRRTA